MQTLPENRQRPLLDDTALRPYAEVLQKRHTNAETAAAELQQEKSLCDACDWHIRYGMHRLQQGWHFQEWLPNATEAWLVGDFSGWRRIDAFKLTKVQEDFTGDFPPEAIQVGQQYRLFLRWPGGEGERLPSATTEVARNTPDISRADTCFNALVPDTVKYAWKETNLPPLTQPLVYEAHVGMAQERRAIGSFSQFRRHVLPRIAKAGYNVIQLMGIQHHPYYASFGYHVSSFFAVFDQLGSLDSFRKLIEAAHARGIRVIIDLVHSHAASNEVEGLSHLDGTEYQFFHAGPRGTHPAWGSRLFDYAKPQVKRFLLSNCRYWMEEFHIDGFRFDGITSMLYRNHGLGVGAWNYETYFDSNAVDEDAVTYLTLANSLIHQINPQAITIAEDVSGFPGLGANLSEGGCGFDYRLAMGVTDYWFKLADLPDEQWDMGHLWYELNSRRGDEKTISYVECHDQALVGGQTFAFRLMGDSMYYHMAIDSPDFFVDRGISLHKMARLITFATAGFGYLNFMGNEFGHPDWIDFPTPRNGWSFNHARRQWSLVENPALKFQFLDNFDKRMTKLVKDSPALFQYYTNLWKIHQDDKVIVFSRNDLLFLFNFHPFNSYTDYEIPAIMPGKWRMLFHTDQAKFGGFQRLKDRQTFYVIKTGHGEVYRFYLPARSALVLQHK